MRLSVLPELLVCQPQPPAALPSGADLVRWLLDLAEAGEDCRSRLGRVRELVR